jgi:hypothetical protein
MPARALAQEPGPAPSVSLDPVSAAFREAGLKLESSPKGASPSTSASPSNGAADLTAQAHELRVGVTPALEERARKNRARRNTLSAAWQTHDSSGHDLPAQLAKPQNEETLLSGEGIPREIEFSAKAPPSP